MKALVIYDSFFSNTEKIEGKLECVAAWVKQIVSTIL